MAATTMRASSLMEHLHALQLSSNLLRSVVRIDSRTSAWRIHEIRGFALQWLGTLTAPQ